jgi:hypothetical protein
MENWIATEGKPSNDQPATARYTLMAGELGNDPTKEQIRAVVMGNASSDRSDELLRLEKCLDTLIKILRSKLTSVRQEIEDRR